VQFGLKVLGYDKSSHSNYFNIDQGAFQPLLHVLQLYTRLHKHYTGGKIAPIFPMSAKKLNFDSFEIGRGAHVPTEWSAKPLAITEMEAMKLAQTLDIYLALLRTFYSMSLKSINSNMFANLCVQYWIIQNSPTLQNLVRTSFISEFLSFARK
jgi:hypothetical protein